MQQTLIMTVVAMIAFAANSLLARQALGEGAIDASTYTVLRIASGAAFMWLMTLRYRKAPKVEQSGGSWVAAAALFCYAIAFSYAYLALGAATGALILFSSVQATMNIWSIAKGERPAAGEIIGFIIAFGAFVYLILPGVGKPDLTGSLLMILSGISWGVYTLKGRGSANPLGDTAGNFGKASVFCVPFAVAAFVWGNFSLSGILLALASGIVASGLGYAVWYRALPGLSAFQAALVQLSVPVIAAVGGALLLGEALSLRFTLISLCLLGGIAVAIVMRQKRQP